MTKSEQIKFVQNLANEELGQQISTSKATEIYEKIEQKIISDLSAGEKVLIPGGYLVKINVPSRECKNPKTGEKIVTEPYNTVKVKITRSGRALFN